MLLFAIFAGILVFASTVGFILKQKAGTQSSSVIDNLNARINPWWVMLIVIAAAILLGKTAFIVLFGIISLFALREFISSASTRRGDYFPITDCILFCYSLSILFDLYPLVWPVLNLYSTLCIFINSYCQLKNKKTPPIF